MRNESSPWIPRDPEHLEIRPLSKGMVLHLPPQALEKGALLKARNVIAGTNGLKRRPVLQLIASGLPYSPAQDLFTFWTLTGTQKTLAVDQKFLYQFSDGVFTGIYRTYSTGTVEVSGTTVTVDGSVDLTTLGILAGDTIVLDVDGTPEVAVVGGVASATTLTLAVAPSGTYGAGTDYTLRYAFGAQKPYLVDWATNGQEVFLTDAVRPLWAYDGTDLEPAGVMTWVPTSVCYYADRIFCGDIFEGSNHHRQRIRHSGLGVANHKTFAEEDYLDLPYSNGAIQRLVTMSEQVIAFFTDAVYLGRATNRSDLPVAWRRIETGSVGLVGKKAVASYLDGVFFVGQDNIYLMTPGEGLRPIGTPVVRETIDRCQNLWRVVATPDPDHKRICFGFPEDGDTFSKVWSYNYQAQAWSYDDLEGGAMRALEVFDPLTWGDLTDTASGGVLATDDWTGFGGKFPTWESAAGGEGGTASLYILRSGSVYALVDGTVDADGISPTVEIITPDYDMGAADFRKRFSRLTVKTEDTLTDQVDFTVEGSVDRGRTWKALGTLSILPDDDEGKVNFRLLGGIGRFRLVSQSAVGQYIINEITLRVGVYGEEVPART